MTTPQQPPPQAPPPTTPQQDESSILPVVLASIAAYLAAKQLAKGPWRPIAMGLGLAGVAGNALDRLSRRALDRQGKQAGKQAAATLWAAHERAVKAGVDAGLEGLVRVILGVQDRMAEAAQAVSDANPPPPGGSEAPGGGAARRAPLPGTAEAAQLRPGQVIPRPILLNTVQDLIDTVVNTAQATAAQLTEGWTKTWQTRQDQKVRESHRALSGATVGALETFNTADGPIRYPHDPKAPIGLTANCRCSLTFTYTKAGQRALVPPNQLGNRMAASADPRLPPSWVRDDARR